MLALIEGGGQECLSSDIQVVQRIKEPWDCFLSRNVPLFPKKGMSFKERSNSV